MNTRPSIVYDVAAYAVVLLILAADPISDAIAALLVRILR